QAEAVEEGLQRYREADRRAVGEREHEPLPATAAALLREEREVRGHVHARERDRRVGLVAERGRRADDGDGARVRRLELARGVALDGGEDEVEAVGVEVRRVHHRRSEEHTSELQSPYDLVCRLLLEKKKYQKKSKLNPRPNQLLRIKK